jgi:hypothetical protein
MHYIAEIEELEYLRDRNDGLLVVADVLKAAREEASPLHKHFDWNDGTAAEKYREWQARILIQKCRVTIESRPDVFVKAYVSVPVDRNNGKGGGYRAVQDVIDDAMLRADILSDIRKRIAYWQRQHHLLDGETLRALKQLEVVVTPTAQQELRAG